MTVSFIELQIMILLQKVVKLSKKVILIVCVVVVASHTVVLIHVRAFTLTVMSNRSQCFVIGAFCFTSCRSAWAGGGN